MAGDWVLSWNGYINTIMNTEFEAAMAEIKNLAQGNTHTRKSFEIIEQGLKKQRLRDFKAGMTEAAEIAEKHYEDQNFNAMYRQAGYEINAAILSTRDRKESL